MPTRSWYPFAGVLIFLTGVICFGCTDRDSASPSTEQPKAEQRARALLEKVQETYQGLQSYADNTAIVERSVLRSTGGQQEIAYSQLSLAFTRPNKISLNYEHGLAGTQDYTELKIRSNGEIIRANLNQLPGQILETIAPVKLTPRNFVPSMGLRSVLLQVPIENLLPQIPLLLNEETNGQLFAEGEALRLLPAEEFQGVECARVQVNTPSGNRVFWIDPDTHLLRRIELPIDQEKSAIDPNNQLSHLSISLDFSEVTIDSEIDPSTFELEVPSSARRMRRLVTPPPSAPPEMLGQVVEEFAFDTLTGESVQRNDVEGKVVVLDFWATNCSPCKMQTPVLQEVYQQLADRDDLLFYSVSVDRPAIPDRVVRKTLESWGGQIPVLRDSGSTSHDVFQVNATPTLVVLDRESRWQVFEPGVHLDAEKLLETLRAVLDGEDLAAEAKADYQRQAEQNQTSLKAATIHGALDRVDVPRAEISPRALPENFRAELLWQTRPEQLQSPGEVVIVDHADNKRKLLVVGRQQEIVEFDLQGTELARHELSFAEEATSPILRAAVDSRDRQFTLLSGERWQRIFLLDEDGETLLTFPEQRHSGVGDVLFLPSTETTEPQLLVGYHGGRGIQCGTLDDRQSWSVPVPYHVLQLVPGPRPEEGQLPTVYCTSLRGSLLRLTGEGKVLSETFVDGHSICAVAVDAAGKDFCGIATAQAAKNLAVGFDEQGKRNWEYELSDGRYHHEKTPVHRFTMGEETYWLVLGPDASLHWLDSQGERQARFDYGEPITGVASFMKEDHALLFVATSEALSAWKLSPADRP